MEHSCVDRSFEQMDPRVLKSSKTPVKQWKDAKNALSYADQNKAAYFFLVRKQQAFAYGQLWIVCAQLD